MFKHNTFLILIPVIEGIALLGSIMGNLNIVVQCLIAISIVVSSLLFLERQARFRQSDKKGSSIRLISEFELLSFRKKYNIGSVNLACCISGFNGSNEFHSYGKVRMFYRCDESFSFHDLSFRVVKKIY